MILLLVYPICKIVLSIMSIENIGKKVKNNYNNDKRIEIYGNYLKFLIVTLYIVTCGCDIFCFLDNLVETIFTDVVIGFGGILLIYLFSRRKKLKIKSIAFTAIICIVLLELSVLPTVINRITYKELGIDLHSSHNPAKSDNEEFEAYFGEYVTGANVRALLQKIRTHNSLVELGDYSDREDGYKYVIYEGETYKNNINDLINKIRYSKHFRVFVMDENKSESNKADAGYYMSGHIKTIILEITPNKEDN